MNRDWWAPLAQWALWGIAMTVVTGWLARSRLRKRPDSERRTLVYPVGILVIGIFGAVFFFGIAILSNTIGKNPTATVWTTLFFIAFGLASSVLIADYFLTRCRVSDRGIEYGRMTGGRGNILWAEVRSVRYAPVMKWFVLEDASGVKARVPVMLLGLPEFAHFVLLHVPMEAIEPEALAVLRKTEQGWPPSPWE
jgi:hypothetical protein